MTCRQHRNLGHSSIRGINPEAPIGGLNDHWEPPQQSNWWWVILAGLVGLILLGMMAFAFAHMHNRPDLDRWFNGLTSANGMPCCSEVDGSTVADPDWDTTVVNGKSHYRVRVGSEWIVVTDEKVVQGPNKYGQPLVWVYHIDGKPAIRCFMPGAGG